MRIQNASGKIAKYVNGARCARMVTHAFGIVLAVLVLLCVGGNSGGSAAEDISLNDLIRETQQIRQTTDEITGGWWVPEEFWRVALTQQASLSESQTEDFLAKLRTYTLLVVVDGKVGGEESIVYSTQEDIRARIQIVTGGGDRIPPLKDGDADADVLGFLSLIKPVIANVAGPLGANMQFFLFPAKNKNGEPICEAKKKGGFTVVLGGKEFKWKLPLGSVLPPKTCPVCGEKLNGAYLYCPWDGAKLQ